MFYNLQVDSPVVQCFPLQEATLAYAAQTTLDWAVLVWSKPAEDWDNEHLELEGREEEERGMDRVWNRSTGKKRHIQMYLLQEELNRKQTSVDIFTYTTRDKYNYPIYGSITALQAKCGRFVTRALRLNHQTKTMGRSKQAKKFC